MTSQQLLILNAGSSSIKFALFENAAGLAEIARGQVERIGADATIPAAEARMRASSSPVFADDHAGALHAILEIASGQPGVHSIAGVGHRITHGGPDFSTPRVLDAPTLQRLAEFSAWAPLCA